MEFVTEDHDYNVTELYVKFKSQFPMLVKITEGYCGNIEDTFCKGEVLLVTTIFKHTRVVARVNMEGRNRLLSFPENFPHNLCNVRKGKRFKKPVSLLNLLEKHTLPLLVQFPPEQVITAGNRSINTSRIPPMELVSTFEETDLLGNFTSDDQIVQEIFKIPLYLTQLRLSPVTGINGRSEQEWSQCQERLKNESRYIAFDLHDKMQLIAEYDSGTDLSAQFCFITPVDYENIVDIFKVLKNDVRTKKRPKSTPVGTPEKRLSIHQVLHDWRRKRTPTIRRRSSENDRHTHQGQLNDGFSDEETECKPNTVTGENVKSSVNREPVVDPTDDKTPNILKISRQLPEESDKKLLISDCHIENERHGGVVREKKKQPKFKNSGDLHTATEHSVESKHVQKKRMLEHNMVEEWLERIPQNTCKKEAMSTDQSKLIPKSQKFSETVISPKTMSTKTIFQLQNSHLHSPVSPKSLIGDRTQFLSHGTPISPKSLSKCYPQSSAINS